MGWYIVGFLIAVYAAMSTLALWILLMAKDRERVVRCKDCIYWKRIDKTNGKCPFLIGEHQYASPEHYCSCGERKEQDDDDR